MEGTGSRGWMFLLLDVLVIQPLFGVSKHYRLFFGPSFFCIDTYKLRWEINIVKVTSIQHTFMYVSKAIFPVHSNITATNTGREFLTS